MWHKFSEHARKAVYYAQEEAQKYRSGYVNTEHLLLGLLRQEDSDAMLMLQTLGISPESIVKELKSRMPDAERSVTSDMTLTPQAKRAINLASDESRSLNHNYIGTEHLLLGIFREGGGLGARTLDKLGFTLDAARHAVPTAKIDAQPADQFAQTLPSVKGRVIHERAETAFLALRRNIATPEWIFLLCVADELGVAAQALRASGLNVNVLQTAAELKIKAADVIASEVTLDQTISKAAELAKVRNQPLNTGYLVAAILALIPDWLSDHLSTLTLDRFLEEVAKLGE
jgi:ATP-dependent Clp protease ATP-binding subunit ClpA